MTDSAKTPETLPAVVAFRRKYAAEGNTLRKLLVFLYSLAPNGSELRHLKTIASDLDEPTKKLAPGADEASPGEPIKLSVPSREALIAELQEMRKQRPDLSPRKLADIDELEKLINEKGETNFLTLAAAAVKAKNDQVTSYRLTVARSFLDEMDAIRDLYSDHSGFTTRREDCVSMSSQRNRTAPTTERSIYTCAEFPIEAITGLKKLAGEAELNPEQLPINGSLLYVLKFSGEDVEWLEKAGAQIKGSNAKIDDPSAKIDGGVADSVECGAGRVR